MWKNRTEKPRINKHGEQQWKTLLNSRENTVNWKHSKFRIDVSFPISGRDVNIFGAYVTQFTVITPYSDSWLIYYFYLNLTHWWKLIQLRHFPKQKQKKRGRVECND